MINLQPEIAQLNKVRAQLVVSDVVTIGFISLLDILIKQLETKQIEIEKLTKV